MVFSISGLFSTEQPQMIRARLEIFPPTSAAAFSASETVIVGSANDADQRAGGILEFDVAEQGRRQGLGDRLGHAIGGALALAESNERHTAILHDGQDIGVIEVDQSGPRDNFGVSLDRGHQDRVCELERRVQGTRGTSSNSLSFWITIRSYGIRAAVAQGHLGPAPFEPRPRRRKGG